MQIKKEDIRTSILTVAERLFIKRGYEDASLKMIAGNCNISKSNIYRYFRSKEEIYETIVGPAREAIISMTPTFFSQKTISKSAMDKSREMPLVLAGLLSKFRSAILIMLRSEGGKDRKMIEKLITDSFVNTCPIEMSGAKELISKMLIYGLTDILIKYSDEEDLLRELRSLICYHYLGLDGLKEAGAKL